jgi:hypothetical protein
MTATQLTTTKRRGRPVLGAFAGFFFGLFLSIVLLTTGVIALDSILLIVFPILFLALGIAWAFWAPLGKKPPKPDEVPAPVETVPPATTTDPSAGP